MGQLVEFIPAETVSEGTEETLGALSREPNLKFLKLFPKKGAVSRAAVVAAFGDAFEQIGGVSRLALWADSHPDEFFKLYARLLPPSSHPDLDGNKDVRIQHVLPPTALDQLPDATPDAESDATDD